MQFFKPAWLKLLNGDLDWDSGAQAFKVMLIGTGYTFDSNDEFVSDFNGKEINGSGYVGGFGNSGRKDLTDRQTIISGNDIVFLADNISWIAINAGTVTAIAIIREVTNDGSSEVVLYDNGDPLPYATEYGQFDINWQNGIVIKYVESG